MNIGSALEKAQSLVSSGKLRPRSILIVTEYVATVMTLEDLQKYASETPVKAIIQCAMTCKETQCVISCLSDEAFEPFCIDIAHLARK